MDNRSVIDILRGVPYTFVSDQPNFLNFFQTLSQTLTQFTTGNDALTTQLLFKTALGKSLDTFGGLLGNPRENGESDTQYINRILTDYNGPFGTLSAIQTFIQNLYSVPVSVVSTGTGGGYKISFLSPLQDSIYQIIAENLVWIRPAGVPFFPFTIVGGGSYLTTVNYFGSPRITGSYLSLPSNFTFPFSLQPNTNNIINKYPVIIFTDPVLQNTVNIPRVIQSTDPSSYVIPTAFAGSVTGGSPLSGTLSATQPSGQNLPLTFAIATNPADGTVSITDTSTGTFTYTANAGFAGADSFTFTATSIAGKSSPATESLTVQVAPTSINGSVTGGSPLSGTLSATQPSGQTLALTFAIATNPTNGTVSITNSSTGAFTYTANAGFAGADSFTFTAANSIGTSNSATESITVSGVPPSPNTVTGNLYVAGTEVVTLQ
jgi:hypothetical protein